MDESGLLSEMKSKMSQGFKFGRLTAVRKTSRGMWLFLCECGKELERPGAAVASGNTSSCGCLKRDLTRERLTTHGMSGSGEWNSWRGMIERCENPRHEKYIYYGGAGVTVHPRWKIFSNFLHDLGLKPSKKHSIDRYPNPSGNYEPGNVRWATQSEQTRNLRNTKRYEFNGRNLCLTELALESGVNLQTLSWRIHSLGWDYMKAATTPVRTRHAP